MKHKKLRVTITAVLFAAGLSAQTINWRNVEQQNILNVNAGLEYGLVYGVNYGHQIKCRLPIVLFTGFSIPSGKIIFDDFKTTIGGQIKLLEYRHWVASAGAYGIFRRNENDFVRLLNFGSDFTGIAGYYQQKWFLAASFGFDKAIVTHFRHSAIYKKSFPLVVDGWYEPATGGNFHYGIETGYSLKNIDICLKAGKQTAQDFKTTPLLPIYLSIGFNVKF